MGLNVTVGETAFPLDATLITGQTGAALKQIRHAADPLLQKLTDFLAAVLNSEIQAALNAVRSEQPTTMQTVVTTAIPAAPERFAHTITPADFPLLCCYRVGGTNALDLVGERKKLTTWRAEYVMPELEGFHYGSLLGLDNAIESAMAEALKQGHHSAYDSDAQIDQDLDGQIEPGDFNFYNWNLPNHDPLILFPAVQLTFTTTEKAEPNNADGSVVQLREFGTTYGLRKDSDDQDDLSSFVVSEVDMFLISSVTVSGTELSITLSKNFDADNLPHYSAWRLYGTEALVTAYAVHAQPVLKLTLSDALEAAEIGVATVRLARYGPILTASDGLGEIREHDPVIIAAP